MNTILKIGVCEECCGVFIKTDKRMRFCPPSKLEHEMWELKKEVYPKMGKKAPRELVSRCASLNRQKRFRSKREVSL